VDLAGRGPRRRPAAPAPLRKDFAYGWAAVKLRDCRRQGFASMSGRWRSGNRSRTDGQSRSDRSMDSGNAPAAAAQERVEPTGPLKGLKVIDLSRVLGGPFCTQTLADLGATVIKVEPPQGDETREWGPPFHG